MRRSPLVPAIHGAASRAAHSTSTKSAPAVHACPVRVGDGVKPDLDQIGLRLGASAAIAQLGERLGANDDAEVGHK